MDAIDPKDLVGGYVAHIALLSLTDENDRHVLSAPIHARASVIVTYNLSDFPREALAPHWGRALDPEAFLVALMRRDQSRFVHGMQRHRASLCNPSKSEVEYLATLRGLLLSSTARLLKPAGEGARLVAGATGES